MRAARFAIASAAFKYAAGAVTLAACAGGGCQKGGGAGESETQLAGPPPDLEMQWTEQPLAGAAASAAQPVAVAEGAAPLLYLSDLGATVRVMDLTAGKLLAEVVVGPRTIVRVDERNGVVADSEVLFAGPLPKGRRYGIYMVPGDESMSRTGTLQPKPPRKAAAPIPARTQQDEEQ